MSDIYYSIFGVETLSINAVPEIESGRYEEYQLIIILQMPSPRRR
jgi:hypothetical protein